MATLLAAVGTLTGVSLSTQDTSEKPEATPQAARLLGRSNVDIIPLTCVILSVVVGAGVGVYGRTHEWLMANRKAFISNWQEAGLTKEQALQLLIRASYGDESTSPSKSTKEDSDKDKFAPSPLSPVLFSSAAPAECQTYQNLYGHDDELARALAASKDPRVRLLTKHLMSASSDPKLFAVIVKDLICSPENPGLTQ